MRAPVVWSALFKRYDINAVLLPAHVDSAGIDKAILGAKSMKNVGGLMFTMPHKEVALSHADTLTERARLVGAINLLRPDSDGRWTGDNVDGAGFVAGLRADGVALAGLDVHVHGCGGVGRNIAWWLAMQPIASLTVFDIDAARPEDLVAAIAKRTGKAVRCGMPEWPSCGLAVNASPLGLKPHDTLPFPVDAFGPAAVVADVIMEPTFTALLQAARVRGLKIHHGRNISSVRFI